MQSYFYLVSHAYYKLYYLTSLSASYNLKQLRCLLLRLFTKLALLIKLQIGAKERPYIADIFEDPQRLELWHSIWFNQFNVMGCRRSAFSCSGVFGGGSMWSIAGNCKKSSICDSTLVDPCKWHQMIGIQCFRVCRYWAFTLNHRLVSKQCKLVSPLIHSKFKSILI